MARNYMQDITPGDDEEMRPRRRAHRPEPVPEPEEEFAARSIRDIRPSQARSRLMHRPEPRDGDYETPHIPPPPVSRARRAGGIGIWIAAIAVFILLSGTGLLFAFASTTITVIPHSQTVTFDASTPFTAYPEASAAPGTIPYTVMTQVFEDSAVVQANGTEEAEEKATGNVTIYNNFTDRSVELIKNTRFQTPDGLIFRIPASVQVPPKQGNTPGSVEVTVFADQNGPSYNVGPFEKLVVPGLKSNAEMYENVYGKSSAAFSGGFSGTRPAVSPQVLEGSKAEVRNRLNEKAQEFVRTASGIAFPGLVAVNFEALPPTEEGSGSVRIHERATVSLPVFPADRLAQSIGRTVSANAEGQSVSIRFSEGTSAQPIQQLAPADIGVQPVVFTVNGRGQLVWSVEAEPLKKALAGREESAFETVIGGFPAVEEARARIMPFWKTSFPGDPADIEVVVEAPPEQF